MSHRYHATHTNEVQHMILDAQNMTDRQLLNTYNVEIWMDNRVYDLTENHVYSSITEWANSVIEDDDFDYDNLFDGDEMNKEDFY